MLLDVENMSLKDMFTGKWFIRLVMISWIICAVSVLVVFKNMEFIVHGQLYSYGLVFSPDWADAYRLLTWLIFVCLGVPIALSGLALASSFLIVEEVPKKENITPRKIGPPRGVVKVESPQIVKEVPKKVENGNCSGISCPNCNRVFGRALVMLDFRGGKNQMVSVCPYCNHVLGHKGEEKAATESINVGTFDEEIIR